MSRDNRIIWSEGMFIRAQHFQQEARHVDWLIRHRVAGLRSHGWGLTELQIDREMLGTGRFSIVRCSGVFEDGTPFSIPDNDEHPAPLVLPEGTRDSIVYLTLPVRRPGGVETAEGPDEETTARYRPVAYEILDANAETNSSAEIRVGKLRLRYALAPDAREGLLSLGLARIVEVRADRSVVLDDTYIPPVLDCAVAGALAGFLNETQGLLHHRGEALAQRVSGAAKGIAEMSDFLMLQAINRYEPLFAHLASASRVHPETAFMAALSLVGELATFTAANRRPPELPVYRHDAIQQSFAPIAAALRQALSVVLQQAAMPIPLTEHKYGIRVGIVGDRKLIDSALFVLAAKASVPTDRLLRTFPGQIKIGPVEQIRDLVNSALPGIRIRPLPVAPRQIPYHAGVAYFELDRTSPLWKQMSAAGAVALHIAGDFPDLELEFWAIRE